jgi:hypothetical protein
MNIPNDLLSEAQLVSGKKTKTQTVIQALQELIQRKKIHRLLELKGSMKDGYDYKKLRKKR